MDTGVQNHRRLQRMMAAFYLSVQMYMCELRINHSGESNVRRAATPGTYDLMPAARLQLDSNASDRSGLLACSSPPFLPIPTR